MNIIKHFKKPKIKIEEETCILCGGKRPISSIPDKNNHFKKICKACQINLYHYFKSL